jgi:hypothetical protein
MFGVRKCDPQIEPIALTLAARADKTPLLYSKLNYLCWLVGRRIAARPTVSSLKGGWKNDDVENKTTMLQQLPEIVASRSHMGRCERNPSIGCGEDLQHFVDRS